MLIAILFHDTQKLGDPMEKYTRFDHPLLAATFIRNNQNITTTHMLLKVQKMDLRRHRGIHAAFI